MEEAICIGGDSSEYTKEISVLSSDASASRTDQRSHR
jgi:hypothetical protein